MRHAPFAAGAAITILMAWGLCPDQARAADEAALNAVRAHPAADGALVAEIIPDSQAQKVGILPEDIIVSYAGKPIPDRQALTGLVGSTPAGPIAVAVVRGDTMLTFQLQPGKIGVSVEDVRKGVSSARLPVAARYPGEQDLPPGQADGAVRVIWVKELIGPGANDPKAPGLVTTRRINALGQQISLSMPGGTVTSTWDAGDFLLARGHMGYRYNTIGQLESVSLAGVTRMTQAFTEGQVSRQDLPNGVSRTVGYDDCGRPSSVHIGIAGGAGATWTLTRDDNGRIETMTDFGGTVTYAYLWSQLRMETRSGPHPSIIAYAYNPSRDLERQVTYAPMTMRAESFAGPALPATVKPMSGTWARNAGHWACSAGGGTAAWTLTAPKEAVCPVLACTVMGDGRPGLILGGSEAGGPHIGVRIETQQAGSERQGRVDLAILGTVHDPVQSPWLPLPTSGRLRVSLYADGILAVSLARADGAGDSVAEAIRTQLTGLQTAQLDGGSAAAWFDDLAWSTASAVTTVKRVLDERRFQVTETTETVFADGHASTTSTTTSSYDENWLQASAVTTAPSATEPTIRLAYDAFDRLISQTTARGTTAFRWAPGTEIPMGETRTVDGATTDIPIVADDTGMLAYGATRYGMVGSTAWWSESDGVVTTYAVDACGNVAGLIGDLGVVDSRLHGQIGWLEQRTYTAYGIPTVYRATAGGTGEGNSRPVVTMQLVEPRISGPGYRGGWTDAMSGRVRFGGRWYEPQSGAWTRMNLQDFGGAPFTLGNGDPLNGNNAGGM